MNIQGKSNPVVGSGIILQIIPDLEIAIGLTCGHNFSHREEKGYIEQIERTGGTMFPRLTGKNEGKAYQCKIMMDYYYLPEDYY